MVQGDFNINKHIYIYLVQGLFNNNKYIWYRVYLIIINIYGTGGF